MASELYNRVMEQLNKKDKIREYVYLKVYEDADIFTHFKIQVNYNGDSFIISSKIFENCIDYIKDNFLNDNIGIYVNPTATDYDDILFELLEKINIGDINAMNTNHINLP